MITISPFLIFLLIFGIAWNVRKAREAAEIQAGIREKPEKPKKSKDVPAYIYVPVILATLAGIVCAAIAVI